MALKCCLFQEGSSEGQNPVKNVFASEKKNADCLLCAMFILRLFVFEGYLPSAESMSIVLYVYTHSRTHRQ